MFQISVPDCQIGIIGPGYVDLTGEVSREDFTCTKHLSLRSDPGIKHLRPEDSLEGRL
ncbi:MAG: hypothetical protein NXH95_00670 [Pseudomonadaceae bacterium]|nr:hypothetical protein [Pseudomonadaceae bacterium]